MGRLRHAATYNRDERGIACGTRVLWRRRPRSSRRSHDRPGRTGKPSTGRRGPGDRTPQTRKVCVMQSAATVLGVLRERGRRGLPLEELYRQLFNPQLYLLAYGRIYANQGAMTPGGTQETVDGMSQAKIGRIIDAMRHERYRFDPVRRVHIPKKKGKTRPLGLPTWSDKLVGEVVRLLLEAYYEPMFSDRSHGFRPRRGCHTALREIANTWTGTAWFIEGDIADCFGSLDHEVMIGILSEKIHDGRFLRLVRNMLTAGYLEDWRWGATLSGAPQGGVASPILSSIYLHKLDEFVETVLIPEYTRGDRRARNPAYLNCRHSWRRLVGAATELWLGRCGGGWSACPAPTRTTRDTGGCGIADTQTTICSGSPDRRPRPRRSNSAWRSSCVTNSGWNSPRTRR